MALDACNETSGKNVPATEKPIPLWSSDQNKLPGRREPRSEAKHLKPKPAEGSTKAVLCTFTGRNCQSKNAGLNIEQGTLEIMQTRAGVGTGEKSNLEKRRRAALNQSTLRLIGKGQVKRLAARTRT